MTIRLSDNLASLQPSPTLALTAKAKALKAEGVDVLSLAAGEPDFSPPKSAIEASHAALDEGHNKYTPAPGLPSLRKAIADYLSRFSIKATADEIVVSAGGKQAIYNCLRAVLNPGNEVLVPAPWWVSYPPLVSLCGAVPVTIPPASEGMLNLDGLKEKLTDKTRLIIFNSPSNPTGQVATKEEVDALETFVLENDLLLMSDELYALLVYGREHVSPAARESLKDRTLTIGGFSKAFAMTGWRMGFSHTPLHVAKAVTAFQSHVTSNPNSLAQQAVLAALDKGFDDVEDMRQAFDRRRKLVVDGLNSIEGITCREPFGAFYAFPDVSALINKLGFASDTEFAEKTLEEKKVAVVPGSAFAAPGHIRVSYAASDDV